MNCHPLLKTGKGLTDIKKTTINSKKNGTKTKLVLSCLSQGMVFCFVAVCIMDKKYLGLNSDSIRTIAKSFSLPVPQFPHYGSKAISIPASFEWAIESACLVISLTIFMHTEV